MRYALPSHGCCLHLTLRYPHYCAALYIRMSTVCFLQDRPYHLAEEAEEDDEREKSSQKTSLLTSACRNHFKPFYHGYISPSLDLGSNIVLPLLGTAYYVELMKSGSHDATVIFTLIVNLLHLAICSSFAVFLACARGASFKKKLQAYSALLDRVSRAFI